MPFFELIQVALGNRKSLSHVLSAEEWTQMYAESERQAVTGILLHSIETLPAEQRPSQAFLLQWVGMGYIIEQCNLLMDKHCADLLKKLDDHGLHGAILKGQGIARIYDKELQSLRQSGDIDVFVDCGLKKALEFADSLGQKDIDWDYKHLHLHLWDGTEVEMHYHVEVLLNLWKNRRLQKWFHKHQNAVQGSRFNVQSGEIVTPSVEFNVFYILLHIYRHFLYEGIGLRQIIDYYFVLKNLDANLNESYAYKAVGKFGMEKFAKGLMWVMQNALGMPREWMLWEPDEEEGKYILNQVMTGGNFGHHDERLKHSGGKLGAVKAILIHNLHLLTHYPSDTIWAPVWFVWHKLWKIKTNLLYIL